MVRRRDVATGGDEIVRQVSKEWTINGKCRMPFENPCYNIYTLDGTRSRIFSAENARKH
jgi:hypothetical protein